MTSFEIEGKLHKVFDTENKTNSFQAREFVIEVADGNYSQFVKFQLVQDRCALVDAFKEGEMIKVHFDLRGREWQGKYFTNLNAWRIDKPQAAKAETPPPSSTGGNDFPTAADEPSFDDDLPF